MIKRIQKDDFQQWISHPVTKAVFSALDNLIAQTDKELTDNNPIFLPNGEKTIAMQLGYKEGIRQILDINYEDVDEEEDNE